MSSDQLILVDFVAYASWFIIGTPVLSARHRPVPEDSRARKPQRWRLTGADC